MKSNHHDHNHDYDPGCVALVPIFADLTPAEMEEVRGITRELSVRRGESIYFAGREEQSLYVIHSGRVKISRVTDNGKAQVIRVLGPGSFMGELSVLHRVPRSDFAEAVQDSVMCVIPGAALTKLMLRFPSIALKALQELSSRLEEVQVRLEQVQHASPEFRLAQALLQMADTSDKFTLPMSKGDLASQLGMTQETLSRKLGALQDAGLIAQPGPGQIHLLDRDGLANVE